MTCSSAVLFLGYLQPWKLIIDFSPYREDQLADDTGLRSKILKNPGQLVILDEICFFRRVDTPVIFRNNNNNNKEKNHRKRADGDAVADL